MFTAHNTTTSTRKEDARGRRPPSTTSTTYLLCTTISTRTLEIVHSSIIVEKLLHCALKGKKCNNILINR